MFCTKCGNQMPEDAAFCQKCGTKVEQKADDTVQQATDDAVSTSVPTSQALNQPGPVVQESQQASSNNVPIPTTASVHARNIGNFFLGVCVVWALIHGLFGVSINTAVFGVFLAIGFGGGIIGFLLKLLKK